MSIGSAGPVPPDPLSLNPPLTPQLTKPHESTNTHTTDGSYLYLFLEFAFKRFVLAPREKASKRGGKTPAAAAESSEAASQKKKQKPQ